MGVSLEVAAIVQERNYAILEQVAGTRGVEMETELVELVDFSDAEVLGRGRRRDRSLGWYLVFWF